MLVSHHGHCTMRESVRRTSMPWLFSLRSCIYALAGVSPFLCPSAANHGTWDSSLVRLMASVLPVDDNLSKAFNNLILSAVFGSTLPLVSICARAARVSSEILVSFSTPYSSAGVAPRAFAILATVAGLGLARPDS